jgi:Zn-dependent protease
MHSLVVVQATLNQELVNLGLLLAGWLVFYFIAKRLHLDERGFEIHPAYVMYKSTVLNDLLMQIGNLNPRLWRIVGNMAIVSFFGQVSFMSYLLFQNLYKFIFIPAEANPVMPIIPGVTVSMSSLPMFLAAAGFVILFHEIGHGVMCTVEDIKVKSSAVLFAVITFGGAVEPEEESMRAASILSQLRVFAVGSFVNLIMGVILNLLYAFVGGSLPSVLSEFLNWSFFLSVNLAMVNMLPIFPLDGGQMTRVYLASKPNWGIKLERLAMFCFLGLMMSNLLLSLVKFGIVPL